MPLSKAKKHLKPWLMSFGRRKGRAFPIHQEKLVKELLPQLEITLPYSVENLQSDFKAIWIEIGFGGGEHLAHQAQLHPDILFIGCEPYMNGVANLLDNIDRNNLKNVRIFCDDARFLLRDLPDNSIEHIFILFPDPWRKPRHYKRRLVSYNTLDMLARILKKGCGLQLATDHEHYAEWMIEHLTNHKDFTECNSKNNRHTPPVHWIPTRYEIKARERGIETITYLHYLCTKA